MCGEIKPETVGLFNMSSGMAVTVPKSLGLVPKKLVAELMETGTSCLLALPSPVPARSPMTSRGEVLLRQGFRPTIFIPGKLGFAQWFRPRESRDRQETITPTSPAVLSGCSRHPAFASGEFPDAGFEVWWGGSGTPGRVLGAGGKESGGSATVGGTERAHSVTIVRRWWEEVSAPGWLGWAGAGRGRPPGEEASRRSGVSETGSDLAEAGVCQ